MPQKQKFPPPVAGGQRQDLFDHALAKRRKVSLDRIEPEHWALAMRKVKPVEDGRVLCNGRLMSMFASNDYLGLGHHAEVRRAAGRAIDQWGTSTSGSRLLNGNLPLHEQLEARLCTLKGTSSVALFQNGYMANLGTLSTVLDAHSSVFVDSLVHTSVIDGCRMAGARLQRFAHQDLDALERQLQQLPTSTAFLVVVDGIYSMDGDFAPLRELLRLTRDYGGRLMVDDAHATGVAGANGGGSAEYFGLAGVDIVTGTLSKAFASVGGYLAADESIVQLVKANSHPFIYSTSPSPAATAAADKAMQIAAREPERRERLWKNADYLRSAFEHLGLDTGASATPIIPVIFPQADTMFRLTQVLDAADIFAAPIIFPACPKNSPRIRFSVTADHTRAELDKVAAILERHL